MTGHVACECGAITGDACLWSGPRAQTVLVEVMPQYLRTSHEAARNTGTWPANGAIRLCVEKTCADLLLETEGEWAELVG